MSYLWIKIKMKDSHIKIYSEIIKTLAISSTCDRAKVGCIILKDGRIISTGYNGSLPGDEHCSDKKKTVKINDNIHGQKIDEYYDDNHLIQEDHCIRTIHAEQNAICNAAKNGISLDNCEMFVTHNPCSICTKLAIMSGISKIYYLNEYKINENPFNNFINIQKV